MKTPYYRIMLVLPRNNNDSVDLGYIYSGRLTHPEEWDFRHCTNQAKSWQTKKGAERWIKAGNDYHCTAGFKTRYELITVIYETTI